MSRKGEGGGGGGRIGRSGRGEVTLRYFGWWLLLAPLKPHPVPAENLAEF